MSSLLRRQTSADGFGLSQEHHNGCTVGETVVYDLLGASLLVAEDWERLSLGERERLLRCSEREGVLSGLVRHGLLTQYQAARISAGTTFGLVLGNYRVLDRIGAGGMAVVFKAEHLEMRHQVAIKVLQVPPGQDDRLQTRFSAEMRTVARLRHPNIVAALDAGRAFSPDPDAPVLWYMVMEYVAGQDLEEYVLSRGPLPVARACNIAHQVACALAETNKFGLVHRDLKPSNVLMTPEEQAKLLDFGLSRQVNNRLTQAGTVLGTIDFMAPEQARDASTADVRADVYGLGGTLYWCLTGQLPFPGEMSAAEALIRRMTQPPPSLRTACPGLPPELDAVVQMMMALRPEDRYPDPETVKRALLPFLKPDSPSRFYLARPANLSQPLAADAAQRILIVDDERSIRQFVRAVLEPDGLRCDEAEDGAEALRLASATPYDLVLLDVNMPRLSGLEVLHQLRESPPTPNAKIVMFSGQATSDEMAQMLMAGADDYLTKPFSLVQLQGRIQAALRLKSAQDRTDTLNARLLAVNAQLERSLHSRDGDLASVRQALVLALARLVQQRDNEGPGRLFRLQRYVRALAEAAVQYAAFAGQIDEAYVEMLVGCAPLNDIGKVGLPDHILLKPGKLAPEERLQMQAHTTIGADTLAEVAQQHGPCLPFLQMAIDVVRHHHERYDGTGYPDRLAGPAIPLAARIVAIGDVYDALRSRRPWKPALSHAAAVQLLTEASPGQFDPALLQVFAGCAAEFEKTFQEVT
jgi:response regulator RpfG family c-di-GMP phosphodiesterase